jgi:hypothetical protein
MSRKRFISEQIIGKLREAEVALSAEAVEKGTHPDHFLPDCCLYRSSQNHI